MTLDEIKAWMAVSDPIDYTYSLDKCTNEEETRIYERDGKLWAIDLFNNHICEMYHPGKGWIKGFYQPYEVTARETIVIEYDPVD